MQGRFLILSFFFSLFFLNSCSSYNSTKTSIFSDFRNSVRDAEDFKKWISVLTEHGGRSSEVTFVFDNNECRAYILTDQQLLSSLKGVKGRNGFFCPEKSKYCSICINLRDMSVGCKIGKDDDNGTERALLASNQKITLRDIIIAGEKKRETRIVFTGYPAELMLSRALPRKCNGFVTSIICSLSLVPKKNKDVSCITDKKKVVCQALINVRKI